MVSPAMPSVPGTREAWADHLGIPTDDIDIDALRERLAAGTVPGLLQDAARSSADSHIAVDSARTTLAGLADEVARRAAVLLSWGLTPGDRVVINAPSSLDLIATYLATLHAGLVAVLSNPSYTDGELSRLAARAEARALLSDRPPSGAEGLTVLSMAELTASWPEAPRIPAEPSSPTDVALLAFTSGTTGAPKGVPLTHANLLASIRAAMWAWRWSGSDVLVHALPLFHQHGLSGVHATIVAGSSAAFLSRFEPVELIRTVERERATVLFGVPTIHRRLLELDAEQLAPLRRLRLVTSGSAPLPASLASSFRERVGVALLERYGLTESGLNVSNTILGERPPGSVGIPLPGIEVALLDSGGQPAPPDAEGEIAVRGPQIFEGYLRDPQATADVFWPGGWFRTGDLGRWGADGRLRITGRLKDLIITGGMNVSPSEVEEVVAELPEIAEAAAGGLPSEQWGEQVAVWVVPSPGAHPLPEAVIAHCRDRLAAYKCPKQVFVVESLPRNELGKVVRKRLAEEAAGAAGRP